MTPNKVWIYQSDRFLHKIELDKIDAFMQEFVSNWKAHGVKLSASYELLNDLFLVIKVVEDKQNATGCSIDASVHALKELQQQLGVNFFNRQRVAYLNGSKIEQCSMTEFKKLAKEGVVNNETQVFNNTVITISEFENNWIINADASWHKMLLN